MASALMECLLNLDFPIRCAFAGCLLGPVLIVIPNVLVSDTALPRRLHHSSDTAQPVYR